MTLAPRWLRARAGVRAASALSAAAVVALALVVAGVALILLVGHSLSHSVETDAVQKAHAIADRMHGNYGKRVNGTYTPKENAVEALDTLIGRGDPRASRVDEREGPGRARAGARGARRGGSARRDHERHDRAAGERAEGAAAVRRRRQPRAAQPARHHRG